MYRYAWVVVGHDGSVTQQWNEDGSKNQIDINNVKEFHLMASPDARKQGIQNFSLFLTKDQRLIYRVRRHLDSTSSPSGWNQPKEDLGSVIHLVGYEEDHHSSHFSAYCLLMPDGRVEWSHDYNHITRHERNLDLEPLRFYERE